MYCAKCGSIVSENKNFCGNCGSPVNPLTAQVPVQQNAVINEVPAGTDAPVVNKKKKASVGSVITAIVCILIDVISLGFGSIVLCLSALMSLIAPFGMMIGAYYEETYLLAFIAVGISALACAAAIMGIVSSVVNVSMSKQEVKKVKPVLMLLPFAFTVGSLILNVIPLVFYANM